MIPSVVRPSQSEGLTSRGAPCFAGATTALAKLSRRPQRQLSPQTSVCLWVAQRCGCGFSIPLEFGFSRCGPALHEHNRDITIAILAQEGSRPAEWATTTVSATVGRFGINHRNKNVAAKAPAIWATMNGGTSRGAIPANVSDNDLAIVTAGLAKEVDAVNQYAAAM